MKRLRPVWVWLVISTVYLGIRVFGWQRTVLVEDHGSISQLARARELVSFDWSRIAGLEPDTTPFYPFFIAAFSIPGWSLEAAGRLCSLAFSLVLLVAVALLAVRVWDERAAVLTLILLALNPVMVGLGYAIITEPSYIATVYLGLALFWWQMAQPSTGRGAALGGLFGLAFLNRVEGLLFLVSVPLAQGIQYLWAGRRSYRARALTTWAVAYAVAFVLVAAPQVWWVSCRMGQFAINGREVWSAVLVQRDGRSYEQKVYGLDYSPSEINLEYLQHHPEALPRSVASPSPKRYLRLMVTNGEELYRVQLVGLVGPAVLVLSGAGLLAMVRRGRTLDAVLLMAFIAANLAGPLLHNVVMRHVAVVAPAWMLLAGIGIGEIAWASGESRSGARVRAAIGAGLLSVAAIGWLPQLHHLFARETCNKEYCDDTIRQAARRVRVAADSSGIERPVVASRKQYLAYAARGRAVALPATDLAGLRRFLELSQADFAFFERWQLADRPFADASQDELHAHGLVLLTRLTDARGRVSELYRVRK